MKLNKILDHVEKSIGDNTSIKNIYRYTKNIDASKSDDDPAIYLVNSFSRKTNIITSSTPQLVDFIWTINMLLTCGVSLPEKMADCLDSIDEAIRVLNDIDQLQVIDYGTTDFLLDEAMQKAHPEIFLITRKFSLKIQKEF